MAGQPANEKPFAIGEGFGNSQTPRDNVGVQSGQFLLWSTSLFLAIHGIIARSWLPTCSIG